MAGRTGKARPSTFSITCLNHRGIVMLERWIIGMVISFVLRQVAKFKHDIDWNKVKSDLDLRVRALVPGDWFDDEAVLAVNVVLDMVKSALSAQSDLEAILTLLAASDWQGAALALKDLLLKVWNPAPDASVKLKKLHAAVSAQNFSAAA